MDVDPDQLREVVEAQHGGKAVLVQAVPVREDFQGQPSWEGAVQVFHLFGHPTGDRVYAWSYERDDGGRRFVAVLHAGPIQSPADAVRAALVAEHRANT